MPTTRSKIPYIVTNQASKEVTFAEAMNILDVVVNCSAINMSTTTPPASPVDGDIYVVATGATGIWQTEVNSIAAYQSGWVYIKPFKGLIVYNESDNISYRFSTLNYSALSSGGSSGGSSFTLPNSNTQQIVETASSASTGLGILEEELTLTGASVTSTIMIPSRSIVEAVCVRTTHHVTGAAAYDCGVTGETTKYGGRLSVFADSVNIGVTGPTAFYSPTSIILTAQGGSFTGGRVRVSIHYKTYIPPQS
jgi:hypothetical protein